MYNLIEFFISTAIIVLFLFQPVSVRLFSHLTDMTIQIESFPFKLVLKRFNYNQKKKRRRLSPLFFIFDIPRTIRQLLNKSTTKINALSFSISEKDPFYDSFRYGGIYLSVVLFLSLLYFNASDLYLPDDCASTDLINFTYPTSEIDITLDTRLYHLLLCTFSLITKLLKRRIKNVGKQNERHHKSIT